MSGTNILATLRSIHFFHGISPEELHQVATAADVEEYPPGGIIFHEGDRGPRIFLVAEGSVSLDVCVRGRGCRQVQVIGPGELLGWSPALDQLPMTATARALTPTRLVGLEAGRILALCHHDPQFGFTFMRQMARALATRLTAVREQLPEAYHREQPVMAGYHEGAD